MRYSAATVGLSVMGYVAENRVIQAALGKRLKERSDVVDFMSPVRCVDLPLSYILFQTGLVLTISDLSLGCIL